MLPVFIVDEIPQQGDVSLVGDEAHHAATVTRVKLGDELLLTDGRGVSAHVKVSIIEKKSVTCVVISREIREPSLTRLTVVQALTKGDRARETIELLTEAGVDEIIPWSAQRSIGQWKDDAQFKWTSWAREATKQSRRNWIPVISPMQNTSSLTNAASEHDCLLVFHEGSKMKLSQVLQGKSYKKVLLVIGPEGGLTEEEVHAFVAAGGVVVGMGLPVFRSAHAGAAALAAVQTALGIW
ncbi:MAG: 16S rRNA (uracil(1498)-N(3))-methyltransferase [Actinomycetota bacterium]